MNNLDKFFNEDSAIFATKYLSYLSQILKKININSISDLITSFIQARERGATIFFIGNGGSAATASHFANDLAIGTNSYEKPFKALSLTDNQAAITSIANDFGYEEIFMRQIQVLGKRGDLLVGISASGNSPNLIKAFNYAQSIGIFTVAITAFDGGNLLQIANLSVHVPTESNEYGPAEDSHMILDHLVSAYLKRLISIS